ncbi:MAG TPA: hypothetical protein PKZ32_09920 [Candidatus Melainabacteria bacterium]|nr:hypothetical protein [Candidatus Melainabacteria bacterium]
MPFKHLKLPVFCVSAALFLSMPSLWDYRQERYMAVKDSHTAMLNEEARLKQKKYEVIHEIADLQQRLYQKQKHLDGLNARIAAVQISIRDLERQM